MYRKFMWTQLSPAVCVSLKPYQSLILNCFKLFFLVPSWYGMTPELP